MDDRSTPESTPERDADGGRRAFLKLGLGSAGAVAAVAAPSLVPAQDTEGPEEQVKVRYSLTPHVERFYALNRL